MRGGGGGRGGGAKVSVVKVIGVKFQIENEKKNRRGVGRGWGVWVLGLEEVHCFYYESKFIIKI